MKLKSLAIYAAAITATIVGTNQASADFGVTLRTTTNDGTGTAATRLYNDAGFTSAAQTGDPVWLVIDIDGDGIFNSGALTGASYDGTQAGLRSALIDADDYVIFTSVPGPLAGRISQNQILPESAQTGGQPITQIGGTVKPAYALLFDEANLANGATFGFNGPLTASGPVIAGNVDLRIGENISSAAYNAVAVVPEPSTAILAGLGLGLVALRSLRNRKN